MYETVLRAYEALAHAALPVLLVATVKTSALLLGAGALTLVLRRGSAAHRHLVWSLAVAAIFIMPFLSGVVPSVEIPIPSVEIPVPSVEAPVPSVEAPVPAEAGSVEFARGSRSYLTEVGASAAAAAPTVATTTTTTRQQASTPPGPVGGPAVGPAQNLHSASNHTSVTPTTIVKMSLLGFWLTGMTLLLANLALGLLRLRRLAGTASPIASGPLWRAAERTCLRLELFGSPRILQGDDDAIPMTWGLLRPVVLLPAGAEAWTAARIDAVLMHELGHVKRRDYLAQVMAQVACAVYWFNPLVWLASHRMRVEREHACDDLVVSAGHEATTYAEDLLRLATVFRSTGRTEAAALGMTRSNDLRERLVAILDDTRRRGGLSRRRILGALSLTIAVATLLATLTPAVAAPAVATADLDALDAQSTGETVQADDVGAFSERAGETDPSDTEGTTRFSTLEAPIVRSVPGDVSVVGSRERLRDIALPPLARTAAVIPQEAGAMCGPGDGEARTRSSMTNDDRRTIEVEYGDCSSTVRIDGDVEFTDDFSGITRLASNAFVRFDVDRGRSTRRLEIRPGSGGRPEYRWTIDGRDRTFDAEAERWLAAALLDLFRSSSYMARERATWILQQRGAEGVLAEVQLMLSDHAQGTYLAILLEQGNLSSGEVRNVIQIAGREIESDHTLGQVLLATAESYSFDGVTRSAFLEAALSLESDHTQGQVFEVALLRGDLSPDNLEALLTAAAGSIESDHTLGQVLMHVGERYGLAPRLREPYLRAAATIESDHTRGQVYTALLDQPDVSASEVAAVLDASTGIESDHTLSELLIRTAASGLPGAELQRSYLEAASSIESDHSLSQTLMAFVDMDGVAEREQIALLSTAREIDSDHSLAEVLVHFAGRHRVQGAVRDAFLDTADQIGSRHQRERVASSIVR